MISNTSIELEESVRDRLVTQLRSGGFDSVTEVIQAGLELLETRQEKLQALREALIEGESSGEAQALDMAAFIEEKKSSC